MAPARIIVLHNTDYDAELTGPGIDVSSVEISARAIAGALKAAGFQVELVGLQGREVFDVLAMMRATKPDLVFNLCESMAGDPRNEPTFAGLLDLFEIPYTGSDLPALAACLHKRRSKDILLGRGIPTPPHRFLADVADLADPALDAVDYPWFLKLATRMPPSGSPRRTSSGIRRAAQTSGRHDDRVRAAGARERYIDGREINVTLIGNGDTLEMLPLHEIDFAAMPADRPRIVSYAAKWEEGHVDYAGTKPVPLRDANPALIARCEQVARGAWDAHGLRDYARIDLRVDKEGQPWVIDVNPNPDISPDAGVARSAAVAGMSYVQMISKLTDVAWRRIRATTRVSG